MEEDDYVVCNVNGYPEKKGMSGGGRLRGPGVEEDDYVLCGVDGYPEMKDMSE